MDEIDAGFEDEVAFDGERCRREAVALYLKGPSGEPADISVCSGQYARLLEDISKAALEHADRQQLNYEQFEQLLGKAVDVVWMLRGAFIDPEICDKDDADKGKIFWKHNRLLVGKAQNGNLPYIDRSRIENDAASAYIELPFRTARLDRIFVEALMVAEFIPFLEEMFRKPYFPGDDVPVLRQPHILWSFAKSHVINAAVVAGLVALTLWTGSNKWIGEGWAFGISAVLIVGFFILFSIGVIALPFAWAQQAKAKRKVVDMINSMSNAYAALASEGLISARHVKEQVDVSAKAGTVWPATLYVLLEDIIARTGRF